jgi:uncharacterized membrane protein
MSGPGGALRAGTQGHRRQGAKVLPAMATFGGKVLRTNLTAEQEARLQAALKA